MACPFKSFLCFSWSSCPVCWLIADKYWINEYCDTCNTSKVYRHFIRHDQSTEDCGQLCRTSRCCSLPSDSSIANKYRQWYFWKLSITGILRPCLPYCGGCISNFSGACPYTQEYPLKDPHN